MSTPKQDPKQIFGEALGLTDPGRRSAYLDGACGRDTTLRREVESLLGAHEQAGTFLAKSIQLPESESAGERAGTMIGRYKLLEQIGEGGFGTVWMAEQEEPVRRRVAFKIIKLGMDTREVVARFEAERQALAMMDHPNIASIFDGGATDTGRPYFVMELVKGVTITEYCDASKLSTRERLELFMRVCEAVQHAHQKGIIHRDLKPSNVLVTVKDDQPVPKVIDFGVAKATQARLTEKTVFTRFHQWIGTPAYMSPEQAGLGSLDVDTRSDVYSLGVLLYELLTGRTPFDTQKLMAAGYEAVMRTIREEDPPKPSTRLSTLAGEELGAIAAKRGAEPARLSRLVRGDLDWIVMKALEKERIRRYESPSAFARDLERHLSHEAVTAAPPSTLYRTRRLLLRNKMAAAFTAALMLSLVGGTVLSSWQAWRAVRFADESERARNQTEVGAYASRVLLASQRLEAGDLSQADRLLEDCPPPLRQWEWHYLKRQCQPTCQVLGGQSNEVWSIAASLDGHWLASLDKDGRLSLWNLESDLSQPARTWPALGKAGASDLLPMNKALAFSHDSLSLAYVRHSGGGESVLGLVSIGSTNQPRELFRISKYKFHSLCLSFSPDNRRLMIGCSDGLVRSYDVTSGLQAASYPILAAAFSQDGSRVVSLGVTRLDWEKEPQPAHSLKVFDTSTGRELLAITNLAEPPTLFSLALSPDGERVAAGFVEIVSEHPDGSSAIVGAERCSVVVWDISKREEVLRHRLTKTAPMDLEFSPDGKQLAVACAGLGVQVVVFGGGDAGPGGFSGVHLPNAGKVLILDVLSGEEIASLRGHRHDVTASAFLNRGRRLASASSDRTVRLWELGASRIIPLGGRPLKHSGDPVFYPNGLTPLSPDGRMIAVSTLDTNWDVVDLVTGKTLASVRIPADERIQDAALTKSPSGLVCLSDTALRYWDLASGRESWSLNITNLGLGAERLAISSDGRRVALAPDPNSEKKDIVLLEAGSGRLIGRTNLLGIGGIAFSPDSRLLLAGDFDGNVRVWHAASGVQMLRQRVAEPRPGASLSDLFLEQAENERRNTGIGVPVTAVAVSPDGTQVATAAGIMSAELRLCNMATMQPKWVGPIASTAVAIAFSPDGGRVAVACMSILSFSGSATDLVIFDALSGQELVHLPSRSAPESLAFGPDGARLWGVTRNGMLVFWDASPWPGPITPPAVALKPSVVESLEHRNNTQR